MNNEILNTIASWASTIGFIISIIFFILAKIESKRTTKISEESLKRIVDLIVEFESKMDKKIESLEELSKITVRRTAKN